MKYNIVALETEPPSMLVTPIVDGVGGVGVIVELTDAAAWNIVKTLTQSINVNRKD